MSIEQRPPSERIGSGRSHVPSAASTGNGSGNGDGSGSGTGDAGARPPQDRHAEILDAALELFATIGYRATTMAHIGDRVGIRGPSLYKHVASKQEMLVAIVTGMMTELLRRQRAALDAGGDVHARLERITAVHVQYHAEHRYEAFVGHREIDSLDEPERSHILELRREYESNFRELVQEGRERDEFHTSSDRWSSYAILDMGIGVSAWYNPSGSVAPDELAATYAEFALRMLT